MTFEQLILIITRLVIGGGAAFFAIIAWAKTRDVSWMLVIVGVIVQYGGVVFTILERFGVIRSDVYTLGGVPIPPLVLYNLPLLLYAIALVMLIKRNSLY